jgi:hypothetical protein
VSDRKAELFREEDARWAELCAVLDLIPDERMSETGVTERWRPRDLVAHLAGWMAECVRVLERINAGTYVRERIDVDAMNELFVEACLDTDLPTLNAELAASHTRMLQELDALPELTADAEEWFTECGAVHYEEHVPHLRAFVQSA